MSDKITHHEDLGYTVVSRPASEATNHVREFEVYVIWGRDDSGAFQWQGERQRPVALEDADLLVSGSIKWSGCSNWNPDVCIHFCGADHATRFSTLIQRMYAEAAAEIPAWNP